MITLSYSRDQSSTGRFESMGVHQKTVTKAFTEFVIHELGFGGEIINFTRDESGVKMVKIDVRTRIMGCTDLTSFEGSEEEMRIFTDLCGPYLETYSQRFVEGPLRDLIVARAFKMTEGNPQVLGFVTDMFAGESTTKIALMAAFQTKDREILSVLVKMKLQDLLALYTLVKIDNVSLEDALALAA